jgi:signal transduction histidine kinase
MAPAAKSKLFDAAGLFAAIAVVVGSVSSVVPHQPRIAVSLIACGVCYTAVLVAGMVFVERHERLIYPWLAVLLALGCVAVWISGGETILLLMPLISVTLIGGSGRAALGLVAFLALWIFVVAWRSFGNAGTRLGDYSAAAVFTLAFSQMVVRERKATAKSERLATDVAAKNEQLARYAEQVEELATMQERNRIAREIHDGLGHFLTSAHVRLEIVRGALREERMLVGEHLDRAQQLIREGLGELRRSVAVLRSGSRGRPFAAALQTLVSELAAAGIATDFRVAGDVRPLSAALEFALYRGAQEALNNVRRHSGAKAASLILTYEADEVELRVADDGVGAPDQQDGFGIRGLRERFEPLGGQITVDTSEDGGLVLQITVPA